MYNSPASTRTISRNVPMDIQAIDMLDQNYARLGVGTAASAMQRPEKDFAETLTKVYDSQVRVVAGTLMDMSSRNGSAFSVVVAKNSNMVPYEEEAVKGWKVLSSGNMFLDDENSIWSVRGTAGSKFLVQDTADDLEDILQQRRSRRLTASIMDLTHIACNNGDYVMYFDTATESIRGGFGYNIEGASYVLDRKSNCPTPLVPGQMLGAWQDFDCINPEKHCPVAAYPESAAFGASEARAYLSYWAKMLSSDSPYYIALEKILKQGLSIMGTENTGA